MTATDPRPGLAAMLAERLAPAAAALAEACAADMNAGPPPEDDRALAERHRAGRAALSHLRQLLGVLDRAAAYMPEPEQAPAGEPGSGYDGSEDEYHYFDEVYAGSQETPEFRAWHAEQERRFGPLVPDEDACDGSEDAYHFGARQYVGRLTTPAFRDWLAPAGALRGGRHGRKGSRSRKRRRVVRQEPFGLKGQVGSILPSRSAGGAGGGPLGVTELAGLRPLLPLARKRPPTRPPPQAGEEFPGGGHPAFRRAQ